MNYFHLLFLYSFIRTSMRIAKGAPFFLFALAVLVCMVAQMDTFLVDSTGECFETGVLTGDVEMASEIPMQEWSAGQEKILSIQKHQEQLEETSSIITAHPNTNPSITNSQRKTCTKRFLQTRQTPSTNTTNNRFIIGCVAFFKALLLISRNLIIVGMLTNTIDVFLPLVLLNECFLMVGLWTCQKHYLFLLFDGVFNSSWDIFNAIRLMVQPSISADNLPQMKQYNLSPLVIFNLSGEIAIAILLLVFTVLSRFSAACLRHQRLRRMAACVRPVWNGYFFAILPRVATFTGIHWRLINTGSGYGTLNATVCGIFSGLMVFYFIALLVQSRQANALMERRWDAAKSLGVVRRIDLKKDFQFDCLRYSSIYFPCMNYLRVLVYCLPIGLFWDINYASYGGAIAAQLGILMAEVSSSSYLLRRDRILFPLQNFMLLVVHLCIITIGLAESVKYSEVSQVAETLLLSILVFVLGSSLMGCGLDAWNELKQRLTQKDDQEHEEDKLERDSAQHFSSQLGKSGKSTTICYVKRNEEISHSEQSQNCDQMLEAASSFKHSDKPLKLKIKKMRQGKEI